MKGKAGYLLVAIVLLSGLLSGCKAKPEDVKLSNGQSLDARLAELEKKLDGLFTAGPSKLMSDKPFEFNLTNAPRLGNADAKAKIVIWSDFQCPYCKRMSEALIPLAKAEPSKYAVYAKELVVHPTAMLEHQAALAAEAQGKYWEMSNQLFQSQSEMAQVSRGDKEAYKTKLVEYAAKVGLNVEQFKADLEKESIIATIEANRKEAQAIPIESTPTVFINGFFHGYVPEEIIAKAGEIAGGRSAGSAGVEARLNSIDKKIDKVVQNIEKMKKAAQGGGENQGPESGKEYKFDLTNAPVIGKPDAKVKLVVFSDFQCPYCDKMAFILEDIQKQAPNDISIYFKDFLIHPTAGVEHEAARSAAAQGKFKEMHDILFKNRQDLTQLSQQGEDKLKEKILSLAKEAGVNVDKLKADLDSGKYREQVAASMKEGRDAGVRGTPSIFVNGYFYGYDPAQIKPKVDEALKK